LCLVVPCDGLCRRGGRADSEERPSRTHRAGLLAPEAGAADGFWGAGTGTGTPNAGVGTGVGWTSLADDWDNPEAWKRLPIQEDGTAVPGSLPPPRQFDPNSGPGPGLTWRPPDGTAPPPPYADSERPPQWNRDPDRVYLPSFALPVRADADRRDGGVLR